MAKKTTEKKASESAPKKVAAKKAPAKKAAAKKAPVKKAAAKKAAPKKAAAKKAGAKSTKQNIHSTAIDITPDRVLPHSLFTDFDIQLFQSGKHYRLYNHFGAHELEIAGVYGTYFAVWAPNAQQVSVMGNFNHWNADDAYLLPRWDGSGIWEGFVPSCQNGEVYKYCIIAPNGDRLEKADPFARYAELRPKTASISWNGSYPWSDQNWMKTRALQNGLNAPYSVYEVHLGSWMRDPENPEAFMSYDALAEKLVAYVKDMNFTHVELMPIMEHPFDGSWGYQVCGYFTPSSRFGSPEGFAHLVDELHNAGIGVILDWVPAHFPGDAHGLYMFDGTHLYEHADPRKGFHPDWKSYIFNLGRNEVRAFMLSSAMYWLDRYHIDGLRVDAVASMLYLDYSRNAGEWIPNEFGGRENLENVSFLKELNEAVYKEYPDVQTIAEESTSWPGVSRPTYTGGLGFGMKWMMGWMNDSLRYFERDPYYRQYHQNEITFSLVYAFTENFMLPFSHDEVVHGKKSMVYKMPGDDWQRMANLRLLYLWMYTHPGTKLLFMGCEFAQTAEWNHQQSLDWHLLNFEPHQGMQKLVRDLNGLYKQHPALYQKQFEASGFEWIDASDSANSVLIFMRKGNDPNDDLVIAMNMTPVPRHAYRIGLPHAGTWKEALNTDADKYYGSSVTNGQVESQEITWQGRTFSADVDLPPLGGMVLMREESGL